jgi:hypothetical protein
MSEWLKRVVYEQWLVFVVFGLIGGSTLLRDFWAVQQERRLHWKDWGLFILLTLLVASTLGWKDMRAERDKAIGDAMATIGDYRPLAPEVKARFISSLKTMTKAGNIKKITVKCATGAEPRELLCSELESLFKEAGVESSHDALLGYQATPFIQPFTVAIKKDEQVEMRFTGLIPTFGVIIRTAYATSRVEGTPDDEVNLYVLGTPLFFGDGTFSFKTY